MHGSKELEKVKKSNKDFIEGPTSKSQPAKKPKPKRYYEVEEIDE